MAMSGAIFYSDGYFALDLYPGQMRDRVDALPPAPKLPEDALPGVYVYWDGEKLERGEYEFLGVAVTNLGSLTKRDLDDLEQLSLPRVTCPETGLCDVEVSEMLRWAMKVYQGPGIHQAGWPSTVQRSPR